MIGRLTGILAEKSPPLVLVDVGGVGYEVDVPMSTFFQLPHLGERVTLLTQFVVREDAQALFGFLTHNERHAFRQLVKVSGVGPRMALAVLSGLSVPELAQAIAAQDTRRLVKVPGIGKKTAERLLLELKDKLAPAPDGQNTPAGTGTGTVTVTENGARADIVQALIALGYGERDAELALKALPAGIGVSDGIRAALKTLVR